MFRRRLKVKSFRSAAVKMLCLVGLVISVFFMGSRYANAQSRSSEKPGVIKPAVMEDNSKITAMTDPVKEMVPATKEMALAKTIPSVLPETMVKGKRTKAMIKIIFQVGLERRKIETPTVATTGKKPELKEM